MVSAVATSARVVPLGEQPEVFELEHRLERCGRRHRCFLVAERYEHGVGGAVLVESRLQLADVHVDEIAEAERELALLGALQLERELEELTEDEIRQYYESHRDDFSRPALYHLALRIAQGSTPATCIPGSRNGRNRRGRLPSPLPARRFALRSLHVPR